MNVGAQFVRAQLNCAPTRDHPDFFFARAGIA
jgi:hypothetical protein